MTAEQLLLPGVKNKKFAELVHGVMYVREPSGFESSAVGGMLLAKLLGYVIEHDLGGVTSEAGGYILTRNPDTVRSPDVAFVRRERLTNGWPSGFFEGAPDLAVEVLSPGNNRRDMQNKVAQYLAAGTRLVWVVDIWCRSAEIHRPGVAPRTIREGGMLTGDDVVPGFQIALASILPRRNAAG